MICTRAHLRAHLRGPEQRREERLEQRPQLTAPHGRRAVKGLEQPMLCRERPLGAGPDRLRRGQPVRRPAAAGAEHQRLRGEGRRQPVCRQPIRLAVALHGRGGRGRHSRAMLR
jgi:hypothetical protein